MAGIINLCIQISILNKISLHFVETSDMKIVFSATEKENYFQNISCILHIINNSTEALETRTNSIVNDQSEIRFLQADQ